MTVLLVEDDPDVRGLLESHFSRMPHIVLDVVQNGSQALGQSVVGHYDLILLDLHLPDIGGLDILPVLRGSLPRAVIAVISGYADLVTEDDFEVADAVIPKPFELTVIDELVELTREMTERRNKIRSLGLA
jgi:DNA-binding response OmpR family regulator